MEPDETKSNEIKSEKMKPEDRPTAAELRGESLGLECPHCGCCAFRVYYTRPKYGWVLRVKVCRHCGEKMQTEERRRGERR